VEATQDAEAAPLTTIRQQVVAITQNAEAAHASMRQLHLCNVPLRCPQAAPTTTITQNAEAAAEAAEAATVPNKN